MSELRSVVRHPATRTLIGTLVGYGILVALLTLLLFVVPYLAFRVL